MKTEKAAKPLKKWKYQGGLKSDRSLTFILAIASFISFLLVTAVFFLPLCIPAGILDYVKNIFLGIFGSALVSWVCTWVSYAGKKKEAILRIEIFANAVHQNYLHMYTSAEYNRTHAGSSVALKPLAEKLRQSAETFLKEYAVSEITSESLDQIQTFSEMKVPVMVELVSFFADHYQNSPDAVFCRQATDFLTSLEERLPVLNRLFASLETSGFFDSQKPGEESEILQKAKQLLLFSEKSVPLLRKQAAFLSANYQTNPWGLDTDSDYIRKIAAEFHQVRYSVLLKNLDDCFPINSCHTLFGAHFGLSLVKHATDHALALLTSAKQSAGIDMEVAKMCRELSDAIREIIASMNQQKE